MLVMVGPDVPEELARKLGERFHVVSLAAVLSTDASPERVFHAAHRNGVAALVTNGEALHEEKRSIEAFHAANKDPGPALPFEVLRWGGEETPEKLARRLEDVARQRGEGESLHQRLSESRRQERGYRRP